MNILLNYVTKDSDLSHGIEVAYKDIYGDYTKTGVIARVTGENGIKNYHLAQGGAYMANELKLVNHGKMNTVQVHFEDSQYDYVTDVSANTTEETANKYFTGSLFNVGIYPAEIMRQCTGITFVDNNA